MKKVTGIGGIFFKCHDAAKMKAWYGEHLGLAAGEYGFNFTWYADSESKQKGSTTWSLFNQHSDYFNPSQKEFMINYRVENLEELVKELTASGITMLDQIEVYPFGKFIHFLDPEGNKIELWEPVEPTNP